jgi:hypothetical protein
LAVNQQAVNQQAVNQQAVNQQAVNWLQPATATAAAGMPSSVGNKAGRPEEPFGRSRP